jgi:hypothetical protein
MEKFENEQAYVAMELTKVWAIEKGKRYDNYINEDDIADAFNTIYKMIGKASKGER